MDIMMEGRWPYTSYSSIPTSHKTFQRSYEMDVRKQRDNDKDTWWQLEELSGQRPFKIFDSCFIIIG